MTEVTRAQAVVLYDAVRENGVVSPLVRASVLIALKNRGLIYEHQEQGHRHTNHLTNEGREVGKAITHSAIRKMK